MINIRREMSKRSQLSVYVRNEHKTTIEYDKYIEIRIRYWEIRGEGSPLFLPKSRLHS